MAVNSSDTHSNSSQEQPFRLTTRSVLIWGTLIVLFLYRAIIMEYYPQLRVLGAERFVSESIDLIFTSVWAPLSRTAARIGAHPLFGGFIWVSVKVYLGILAFFRLGMWMLAGAALFFVAQSMYSFFVVYEGPVERDLLGREYIISPRMITVGLVLLSLGLAGYIFPLVSGYWWGNSGSDLLVTALVGGFLFAAGLILVTGWQITTFFLLIVMGLAYYFLVY